MTLQEMKERLLSTGLPVAYRAFNGRQEPPFLVYLSEGSHTFPADGLVYFASPQIRVELYTKFKDEALESLVETALYGLYWQKSETYIDSEKCYEIIYELEA